MDQLLLPYLQATDESERQQCLDDLMLFHAAPVIRQILRLRLGFHVSQRGTNRNNQEAEDIYQEVLTRIIQMLRDLRTSSPRTEGGLMEKCSLGSGDGKRQVEEKAQADWYSTKSYRGPAEHSLKRAHGFSFAKNRSITV